MATDSAMQPKLSVSVVFSPAARTVLQKILTLEAGSTVADAIKASQLLDGMQAELIDSLWVGVWGRKQAPGHRLRDGDQVEIYRPLKVDPKVARRERFTRQGAKSAGLFAKRRPGAKAGY